jgi:uncharacterized lipoprotein YajG
MFATIYNDRSTTAQYHLTCRVEFTVRWDSLRKVSVKENVKFNLEEAMKAQMVCRGVALLFP